MKKIKILLIILAQTCYANAQDCIVKEQVAFNFLLDSLLDEKFGNELFRFSGTISNQYTDFNNYKICFDGNKELYNKIKVQLYRIGENPKESKGCGQIIALDKGKAGRFREKIGFFKRKNSYTVEVYRSVSLPDTSYVQIRCTKYPYVRDFYFEIDANSNSVLRWCEQGMIY